MCIVIPVRKVRRSAILPKERREKMTRVDERLCTASETQLRNVLALAIRDRTDAEVIALFEREEKMTIAESQS